MTDRSHVSSVPVLSEEMRAKWAQRLSIRVDRSDQGRTLPASSDALALPDAVERLKALSLALVDERVIVPINVERHPDEDGEHHHIDPHSDDAPKFHVEQCQGGAAIAAFTSVADLHAYAGQARPMPLDFRKVALAALVETRGRVVLNPAGDRVVLPRPLVAALAQGDSWLPGWEDRELLDALLQRVGTSGGDGVIGVRLRPLDDGCALCVDIVCDVQFMGDNPQEQMMNLIHDLRSEPRLLASAERVEFSPVPLHVLSAGQ